MENMSPKFFTSLFQKTELIGKNEMGYQSKDYGISINAFKDATWYYPGQMYPHFHCCIRNDDFTLKPDEDYYYGHHISYFNLAKLGRGDMIQKGELFNNYTLRDITRRNGGEFVEDLDSIISQVYKQNGNKKYNIVIVAASRILERNIEETRDYFYWNHLLIS